MVIFWVFTSSRNQSSDVSVEHTASTFRLTKVVQVGIEVTLDRSPWRWRQYVSLQCQNISALCSVITHKVTLTWKMS